MTHPDESSDTVASPNEIAGLADDDNGGLDAEKGGPQIAPDVPGDEQPPDLTDDPNALPDLDERD